MAAALAHQPQFSKAPARRLLAICILDHGLSLCIRARSLLGRWPSHGRNLQLVDDPFEIRGELRSNARGDQRAVERLCDRL